MLYLLDTDTSSYSSRVDIRIGTISAQECRRLRTRELAISALTKAELLYGLRRVPDSHDPCEHQQFSVCESRWLSTT